MVIDQSKVFLDLNLDTKAKVLEFITNKAEKLKVTDDKEMLLKDFIEREESYSTAVVEGVAIPHAKSAYVQKSSLLFLRLNKDVDWDSPDNFKAKLIFAIMVPEKEAGSKHIQILSQIAVKLLEDDFVRAVSNLNDKDQIVKKILESEE